MLIGLGLMLMALHQLLDLVTPYEDTPSLRLLLGVVASSSLHLDALRDIKRVNAHLVAAAAYPALERVGELLPNRPRQDEVGSGISQPPAG